MISFFDMDKLDILMDKNDVTHSEANTSDLERYINQKFDAIIIANTEKKCVNLTIYTSRTNTAKLVMKILLN